MSMKVTNRNARMDKAGKHNDRNFNLDNAAHINQNKQGENLYYTYNGDTEHTFAEIEYEFYDNHFSAFIEEQNKRNEAIRHKERNRTISDYVKGKYTRPEDKILQIGNIKEHATKEELWECAMEYKDRFDEIFGEHCKILDMALHMDEATPHVHVRRVWIAEDEAGKEFVSQTTALEQMGITDPKSDKANGRYNNAKMTFTQTDIKLFKDICIEKGLDIDMSEPNKREHLSTLAYKVQELSKEVEELERTRDNMHTEAKKTQESMDNLDETLEAMEEYIYNYDYLMERYRDELEELRQKDRVERFKRLSEIYRKEIESVISSTNDFERAAIRADLEVEVRKTYRFIESKGLQEEYRTFEKASESRDERTDTGEERVLKSYF